FGRVPDELAGQAGAVTDAVTARQDLLAVGRGVRGQARPPDRSRGGGGGSRYVHGDPLLIWARSARGAAVPGTRLAPGALTSEEGRLAITDTPRVRHGDLGHAHVVSR